MATLAASNTDSRDTIQFLLDGNIVSLQGIDPTRTVIEYLREDLGRTGTKEGCAEGDCGACTVVLATLNDEGDRLQFRAINSCIQFLPTLDGKALITVESLAGANGALHPVQRAMVDCHASQCGFCTPGFVMSLFALYKSKKGPSRKDIDEALAGNLCRCTGYRPIIAAAEKMYAYPDEIDNESVLDERDTVKRLHGIQSPHATLTIDGERTVYHAPTNLKDLGALLQTHPDAYILAGGTDIGLWVTKQHRDLDTVIYIGAVAELRRLDVTDTHLEIGAAVPLSDAVPTIVNYYPDLDELFLRFASPPIRNAATLGGNIANGSPIGDSMPALITLDTTLVLRRGQACREVALDTFYLDYQRTARQPGEVIQTIRIPLPNPETQFRSYKISKRFDQDISAVCGAYQLQLNGRAVRDIRIAYGGLAAIPKRALESERALKGRDWNMTSIQAAMAALDSDYTPISDMRASADYRSRVSRNLLYRFFLESTGQIGRAGVYHYGR